MSNKKQKSNLSELQKRKRAKDAIQDSKRLIMPKILDGDEGTEIPDMPEKIDEVTSSKTFIDQAARRMQVYVVFDHVAEKYHTEYRGIITVTQQMGQHRQEKDIAFSILMKEDTEFHRQDLIEAYVLFSEKAREFKAGMSKKIREQSSTPKLYTA
jgi:hypothetical protein